MKTFFRKLATATVAVSVVISTGCSSAPNDTNSHWNIDSVDNRMVKHFTGYRGPIDGSYTDFQAAKKRSISQTLTRHFLNHNGENPLQDYDPQSAKANRPHSIAPNPISWFHAESVFFGAIFTMTATSFIPVPVDSVIALASSQGRSEFWDGFTGKDTLGESTPPSPATFQVKNR
jgi:hypothetical protein